MTDRTLEQRIRLRLLIEDPEIVHEEEIGTVWPAGGHDWDVRPDFAARLAALEAQDSAERAALRVFPRRLARDVLEALS